MHNRTVVDVVTTVVEVAVTVVAAVDVRVVDVAVVVVVVVLHLHGSHITGHESRTTVLLVEAHSSLCVGLARAGGGV